MNVCSPIIHLPFNFLCIFLFTKNFYEQEGFVYSNRKINNGYFVIKGKLVSVLQHIICFLPWHFLYWREGRWFPNKSQQNYTIPLHSPHHMLPLYINAIWLSGSEGRRQFCEKCPELLLSHSCFNSSGGRQRKQQHVWTFITADLAWEEK